MFLSMGVFSEYVYTSFPSFKEYFTSTEWAFKGMTKALWGLPNIRQACFYEPSLEYNRNVTKWRALSLNEGFFLQSENFDTPEYSKLLYKWALTIDLTGFVSFLHLKQQQYERRAILNASRYYNQTDCVFEYQPSVLFNFTYIFKWILGLRR